MGQHGYRVFPNTDAGVISTPLFKQFRTVVKWVDEKGWKVGVTEMHWRGYVEYAFEAMKPSFPQPGQLKNDYLLKSYIKAVPKNVECPSCDTNKIYGRVLRPEILSDPATRRVIGIDRK
jgi:hypothetical protein